MTDNIDIAVEELAAQAWSLGPRFDVAALRATADLVDDPRWASSGRKFPTRAQCEAAEALILAKRGLL